MAREVDEGRTLVLPIWHGVGQREVLRHAPLLADRVGVSTQEGLPHVVDQVVAALRRVVGSTGQAVQAKSLSRLVSAVPLALLARRDEPLTLAPRGDGCVRSLSVALTDRLVVGRSGTGQLHVRALEALQRRGSSRVHWVTHWDDTALNQISLEVGYRAVAGGHTLAVENLTAYASRPTAFEVIDPDGRGHALAPGERFERPFDGKPCRWVLVLGRGTSAQRLLHVAFEPVQCGAREVPTFRSEGTLFWVPPAEPSGKLVRFFGVWLPLSAAALADLLRDTGADLPVRFSEGGTSLTFFHDAEAGALVDGEVGLEQALGLA